MSTTNSDANNKSNLEKEALEYHKKGRPGKLEITTTTTTTYRFSTAFLSGVVFLLASVTLTSAPCARNIAAKSV